MSKKMFDDVSDRDLVKVPYEKVTKGVFRLQSLKFFREFDALHWFSPKTNLDNRYLNIDEEYFFVPEWLANIINIEGVKSMFMQNYIDGSYYELFMIAMENYIYTSNNELDMDFVFNWLFYFKQISNVLSDINTETPKLPPEILSILEKEAKNYATRKNMPVQEIDEINYDELRNYIAKLYDRIVDLILEFIVDRKEEYAKPLFRFFAEYEKYWVFIAAKFDISEENLNFCKDKNIGVMKERAQFKSLIRALNEGNKKCIDFLSKIIKFSKCEHLYNFNSSEISEVSHVQVSCDFFEKGQYGTYYITIPTALYVSKEAKEVIAYYTYQAMLNGKIMFKPYFTPTEFAHLAPNTVDRPRT